MATSPDSPAGAATIKAELEKFAGHEIDGSPNLIAQQLTNLFIPVGTFSFNLRDETDPTNFDTLGHVASRRVFSPTSPLPVSCTTSILLDITGSTTTPPSGNATFLISSFLCNTTGGGFITYGEPVSIVATPASVRPVFLTVSHSFVTTSSNTNELSVNVFAWDPNGTPAPGVQFHWRCRVPIGLQMS